MDSSTKPKSNLRLVELINIGSPPHFQHIQHLQNSELRLQGASSYQARRIRNCWASKRSQPPADQEQGAFRVLPLILHWASERSQLSTDQEQGAFRVLQLILQHSRSSSHVLKSFKSSRRLNQRITALNSEIVPTFNINTNSICYS